MSEPQARRSVRSEKSRKSIRRWLASWTRWLHIYLSMIAFAVILFFSVTGLTLNHPDWWFKESTVQAEGSLNEAWLDNGAAPPADWDEQDYSHAVSKLEIAEHLRAAHSLRGEVSDFLAFENECEVTFQGPGYAAIARLSRDDGRYTVDITSNDFVTILNDLHKGRHTSGSWSWVIDISAIAGVLVSLTGFVLIFFLRLKRTTGLLAAAAGGVLLWWMAVLASM
ncbi:MAG: PepSY-associated TM helix domain-containing protein [Planctomycetales bacterium]|nr:PepSY-associated TM helix domain-containing protein [Planctomycetales bacterium]